MFKQFDIVQISTTKQIRYLSGPAGHPADPNGDWSIVGFVGPDAVLAKESTLVRVPLTDIRKIGDFNINNLLDKISMKEYFNVKLINMSAYVSRILNIDMDKAEEFLTEYGFKTKVDNELERDQIAERVKMLWQRKNQN